MTNFNLTDPATGDDLATDEQANMSPPAIAVGFHPSWWRDHGRRHIQRHEAIAARRFRPTSSSSNPVVRHGR